MPASPASTLPTALSGRHRIGFAYESLKDRLPVIIVKCVDELHRTNKERENDEEREAAKGIVEKLSELRYELSRNKHMTDIIDGGEGSAVWNEYIKRQGEVERARGAEDGRPRWFETSWLLAECYAYRRMLQAMRSTSHAALGDEDFFAAQKQRSYFEAIESVARLLRAATAMLNKFKEDSTTAEASLKSLVKISLWGNRWDLSISGGTANAATGDPAEQVSSLQPFILVDDVQEVWDVLKSDSGERTTVNIVLDNAGFELISDLCLAEFVIAAKLASEVRFRVKCQPWFVSDTMEHDIWWLLDQMEADKNEGDGILRDTARRWRKLLEDGMWKIRRDPFWTFPHDFSEMATAAPELYEELSASKLVIFKGDLNYRKLVGDLEWPVQTSFSKALRGFRPAPLVTLRTLKAEVVVGLREGQAEAAVADDERWMQVGKWAVVQFCDKK